ncbi:MAG TPA: methyltransferase [Draconibacterium sp.]|nr:methyltransferase [Draconibacterium sp.]
MGRNNYFQFKQFRIEQKNSAMKVGVDGVLLGAWADVSGAERILDVGAGTGLIALMLAQRSKARITAIEIETLAAKEAQENLNDSPWLDRVEVLHSSFQEYAKSTTDKFDLIVSNPPYFSRASKAASDERTLARHNDSLRFEELIFYSSGLLNEKGSLAIIIPSEAFEELNKNAITHKLCLKRITQIRPKPSKKVNRALAQWSVIEQQAKIQELCIYEEGGSFTRDYIDLTRDFYLNF